jgi:hypothetical protein
MTGVYLVHSRISKKLSRAGAGSPGEEQEAGLRRLHLGTGENDLWTFFDLDSAAE